MNEVWREYFVDFVLLIYNGMERGTSVMEAWNKQKETTK